MMKKKVFRQSKLLLEEFKIMSLMKFMTLLCFQNKVNLLQTKKDLKGELTKVVRNIKLKLSLPL